MSKIRTCVSLYSLQDEYLNKRMSLKDIMHYVKEKGAEGVEILPDQMLKGAPDILEETVTQWNQLLAETSDCRCVFKHEPVQKQSVNPQGKH